MIDGLKLEIPGTDVIAHARARGQYHAEKAAAYTKQGAEISTLMEEVTTYQSADPRRTISEHQKQHTQRTEYFALVAKYLLPGESYRLGLHDLNALEYVTGGF